MRLQTIFPGDCKCCRETFQFIREGALSWCQVSTESEELDSHWCIWLYSCVERYSRAGCVKVCYNEDLFSFWSILQSLSMKKTPQTPVKIHPLHFTVLCKYQSMKYCYIILIAHTPCPKSLFFSSCRRVK